MQSVGRSGGNGITIGVVREATGSEKKLRLVHRAGAGATGRWAAWPVATGFFDKVEVLAAWCELRKASRHLRLDRVVSVEPQEERLGTARRILLAEWGTQIR